MKRRRLAAISFLAAAPLLLTAGCSDSGEPAIILDDLPAPLLEGFDRHVRQQLEAAHDKAQRQLQASSEPAPQRAEALGLLGTLYLAYELSSAALRSFEYAHRLDPDEVKWAYYLGVLYEDQGDTERAEEHLQKVLEKQPDNLAARIRLGNLQLESGRPKEAESSFKAAQKLDARLAAVHFGLGRVAARAGDHQTAIASFGQALQLQPEASQIHYLLAQSYRRLGNTRQAREHLSKSGESTVAFPDPLMSQLAGLTVGAPGHAFRGDRAVLDGRLPDARHEYGRAVALAPDNYFYRKSLALTLYQLGEAEAAVSVMREALALDAGSDSERSVAHYTLGGMLSNRGSAQEATEHFKKALELDHTNLGAHLQLGQMAGREGRLEEALEHFQRVLQIDPKHVEATRFAATTNMDLGRFAEAIPHLRRLVELEPGNSRNSWLLKVAAERAK